LLSGADVNQNNENAKTPGRKDAKNDNTAVLARMLEERGLLVERQVSVAFDFNGMHFDEGLRVDLLVDGCLVIELKSVEKLAPVHAKQLLTYLRLLNLPVGLLINFGAATFKEGIRRIVNKHQDFASSRE
jgi:hypothetical protein